jgi:hypothetical protein
MLAASMGLHRRRITVSTHVPAVDGGFADVDTPALRRAIAARLMGTTTLAQYRSSSSVRVTMHLRPSCGLLFLPFACCQKESAVDPIITGR